MKRLSIYLVMVMALGVAATACKKGAAPADSSSYLANPNDTKVPPKGPETPPPDKPCTGKGAMGMNTLLLKGDCTKLKEPKCGNGVTEASIGEECDNGADNGTSGNKCGTDCKKVKVGGGGGGGGPKKPGDNTTGPSIAITTKSLKDGVLGQPYPVATLTAKPTGVQKDETYDWTVTNLPEGYKYELSSDHLTVKISRKDATVATGTFKIGAKVCLHSDPANCDTCADDVCSMTISDQYGLSAFDYKTNDPKKSPICEFTGTSPCPAFELNIDDYMGDKNLGYLPNALSNSTPNYKEPDLNNPFYVLKIKVKPQDGATPLMEPVFVDAKPPTGTTTDCKDNGIGKLKGCYTLEDKFITGYLDDYKNLYYRWSITWSATQDGPKTTLPLLKWMDYNTAKHVLNADEQKGLFLMDFTDEKTQFIHPSEVTIMAGPAAMGHDFYNVVVTAESIQGGKQTMTFPKITLPALTVAQKAVEDNDPCGPTKYTDPVRISQVSLSGDKSEFQDPTSTTALTADKTSTNTVFDVPVALNTPYNNVLFSIAGGPVGQKPSFSVSLGSQDLVGATNSEVSTDNGPPAFHFAELSWKLGDKPGDANATFSLKGAVRYKKFTGDSGQVVSTVKLQVTDSCKKVANATVHFKSEVPKPTMLSEIKYIKVVASGDYYGGDSAVDIQLRGAGANVLVRTGNIDPVNNFVTASVDASCNNGACPTSDLKSINIHVYDPCRGENIGAVLWAVVGGCADMKYHFTELDLITDYWYATSSKDWSGVCDGTDNKDESAYNGKAADPLDAFLTNSSIVLAPGSDVINTHWFVREHPYSTSER